MFRVLNLISRMAALILETFVCLASILPFDRLHALLGTFGPSPSITTPKAIRDCFGNEARG